MEVLGNDGFRGVTACLIDRLFRPSATHGPQGWGLILQPHVNDCTAALYSSNTTVVGCLPRLGGAGAGLYTLQTCGLKGDKNSTDWLARRSDGLLIRWAQDSQLCHEIRGVPSLVICARIYWGY